MSCQVPVKFTLTPVGIQNLNTGKGIGAAALPPALWSPPQNLGAVFGYHPDRHALYAWVPPSPRVRCRQAFFLLTSLLTPPLKTSHHPLPRGLCAASHAQLHRRSHSGQLDRVSDLLQRGAEAQHRGGTRSTTGTVAPQGWYMPVHRVTRLLRGSVSCR